LCTPEFVDPLYLEDYIAAYPEVTFILMHGGQDFADSPVFYNGTNFDHTIELMEEYDNVYLEISAMLAREPPPDFDTFRNPLAYENMLKVVDAGLQNRTSYGSDANQFPGGMLNYIHSTVVTLTEAGYTEDERCHTLVTLPKMIYGVSEEGLPPVAGPTPTTPPSATSGPTPPSDSPGGGVTTDGPTETPATMPPATSAPSGALRRGPFGPMLPLLYAACVVVLSRCQGW
jgi:Amidohydrolase